jgi:long-chain acyl-CoA synthetase
MTTADQPTKSDRQTAPATIPSRIRSWAEREPTRVCLREKRFGIWKSITWQQYWENSQLVAHGLAELGVDVGDRVAIHSENRPEWLYAEVGTTIIRAATVGIYTTNPPPEVAYLLRDSGACVLIAEDQEQVDKALAVADECPDLRWIVYIEPRGVREYDHPKLLSWTDFIQKGREHWAADPNLTDRIAQEVQPDDLATLIYTSGTTGRPKGAMLTVTNLAFAADTLVLAGGLYDPPPGENDVAVSYLPLCHVIERAATVWVNAATGTTIHFAESIDTVQANLREVQPTLFFGVPRIWEKIKAGIEIKASAASPLKRLSYSLGMRLAARIGDGLVRHGGRYTIGTRLLYALGYPILFRPMRERIGMGNVRAAGSGGAPIAPAVLRFFFGLGIVIQEAYGMTENSAVTSSNPLHNVKIGTVGPPYAGTEVRLDDTTNEILIRHPGVFAGYWRKPEDTARVIDADGWQHTGDVGEWVDGTHLKIVDRLKDIIITAGGKNIAPSELENALKASPFINEVVVIGDRRAYCTALIGIELDTVGDWAQRQRIPYTTYRDLSEKDQVLTLVQSLIKEANENVARVAHIRKFRVIPKELDHDDGELTATRKVKRAALHESFAELIEDMYDNNMKFPGGDLSRVHGPAAQKVGA